MEFVAIGVDIFVIRKGRPKERTLTVVGGSAFAKGLAREITEVLNKHYNT